MQSNGAADWALCREHIPHRAWCLWIVRRAHNIFDIRTNLNLEDAQAAIPNREW